MSLGIVLTIRAELGTSPWDVLHIGLYYQLGLTIGTWAIIVGGTILLLSSIFTKKWPQAGAIVNMLTVGVFIDLYLMMPFIQTPSSAAGKTLMLLMGIIVMGYGIGVYISAGCGAGPRDTLMLALVEKTGMKVSRIRSGIELIVLLIGWLLGGPVFIGTIVCTISIGFVIGITLPQCQKTTNALIEKTLRKDPPVHQVS
ncbi:YczE/YyaS/YitT family protein [Metabacillus idriensis]|uniref:YczE/YyaS/YitT family protein n=1 Tax=Metabacillus idriensis TaxID=324768 RepID=UPI001CD2EFF3|nr:YitT family protein [Metabacillus idriensis]